MTWAHPTCAWNNKLCESCAAGILSASSFPMSLAVSLDIWAKLSTEKAPKLSQYRTLQCTVQLVLCQPLVTRPTCTLLVPGFALGIACQQLPSFRETEMLCWLPVWLDYNLHQVEFTCWEGVNAPKTNNLNVWCVQQEETQHVSRSIFGSCIHHLIESAFTLLNMLLWPCCHTWLHFRK